MGIVIWIVAFILALAFTKKSKGLGRFVAVIFWTVIFFFMIGFILLLSGNL